MPALPELQQAIGAAIQAGPGARLPEGLAAALGDPRRLEIHRNHFYTTLADALETTFPVVRRLVGETFFRQAAKAHVRADPPARPCLFEYGSAFPAFLAAYEPCRTLVYLADVARLEWAVNAVYHAPDALAFETAALAAFEAEALDDLRLALRPFYRVVVSPYPIDRIWHAHRGEAAVTETIDLAAGAARLLVRRADDDVEFAALGEGDTALLAALDRGLDLGCAFETAVEAEPDYEPGAGFMRFLALGAFARPNFDPISSAPEETPT